MAGTPTFADVAGTPTGNLVTIHTVDASGDTHAESFPVSNTAAVGDINGLADSYQAASQASIWKVSRTTSWEGAMDPDNAEALFRGSVADGINLLFRNSTTFDARSFRLVAPIAAVMQGNQDIPLLSDAAMISLITDYLTLASGYDLEVTQFTGRRERRNNPRIRV